MAKYKVLNADNKNGIYEFLVDKVSDLNLLPKKTGSTAYIINNGSKYICSNAKEWKVLINDSNNNTQPDNSSSDGSNINQLCIILADHNDQPIPEFLKQIYIDDEQVNLPQVGDNGFYYIDVPAGSRVHLVLDDQYTHEVYQGAEIIIFPMMDNQESYPVREDWSNQRFIMPNTNCNYLLEDISFGEE